MTPLEHMSAEQLADVLSASVGEEKARATVTTAATALGLGGRMLLSQTEALEILARIADVDGLLGLTARFARSRLMAKWATEHLNRANGRR